MRLYMYEHTCEREAFYEENIRKKMVTTTFYILFYKVRKPERFQTYI